MKPHEYLPPHRRFSAANYDDLQRAAIAGDGTASRLCENVRERRAWLSRRVDWILQALIVLFTLPGFFLVSGEIEHVKWGFVILACGQPFWMVANWRARQPGMFLISCVFAGMWVRGIFNSF